LFVQSLEYALSCLLYSPVGDMIMTLATLIGSSPMSLLIFTVLCVIGFIVGICMILYAARETVFLVREVIQEKKE
jgi:hypothetical protein